MYGCVEVPGNAFTLGFQKAWKLMSDEEKQCLFETVSVLFHHEHPYSTFETAARNRLQLELKIDEQMEKLVHIELIKPCATFDKDLKEQLEKISAKGFLTFHSSNELLEFRNSVGNVWVSKGIIF